MAATFIPGLQLAREFYAAEVRPLLEDQFPQLRYAAALPIGAGAIKIQQEAHPWPPAPR